jgi:prepilin-type N-terminal cleavage/methylation domain-containing protein
VGRRLCRLGKPPALYPPTGSLEKAPSGPIEMKIKYAKIDCRSAFTLIEIAVTTAILGVVFVTFYTGIAGGFSLIGLTRENLRADQLLLERMETIRLYSWDQINSNGFIPATFTAPFYPPVAGQTNANTGVTYYGTLVITNFPLTVNYSNNMKMVTATLTWTNAGHARVRTMDTFVSQYGMQSYVY